MNWKYHIEFHNGSRAFFFNGNEIGRLNSYEMKVFTALYSASPNAVEKDELIKTAWSDKIVTNNSLNVAIRNIRVILLKAGLDNVIITHSRVGFSWNSSYKVAFEAEAYNNNPSLPGQLTSSNKEYISTSSKNIDAPSIEASEILSGDDKDDNYKSLFPNRESLNMLIGTLLGVIISVMFDIGNSLSMMTTHNTYHDNTKCIICNTIISPASNKYVLKTYVEPKDIIDVITGRRMPPFDCGTDIINLPPRLGVNFTPSDKI